MWKHPGSVTLLVALLFGAANCAGSQANHQPLTATIRYPGTHIMAIKAALAERAKSAPSPGETPVNCLEAYVTETPSAYEVVISPMLDAAGCPRKEPELGADTFYLVRKSDFGVTDSHRMK
jgi:hypothetical protein